MQWKKWLSQFWFVVVALMFALYYFFLADKGHGWLVGTLWVGVALINLYREIKKKNQSRS